MDHIGEALNSDDQRGTMFRHETKVLSDDDDPKTSKKYPNLSTTSLRKFVGIFVLIFIFDLLWCME
jgi:hypothetical protein